MNEKNTTDYTFVNKARWTDVMKNYKWLKDTGKMGENYPDTDDWHLIVCEGNDAKYGRIAVSDKLRMARNPSFNEFYANSVVD